MPYLFCTCHTGDWKVLIVKWVFSMCLKTYFLAVSKQMFSVFGRRMFVCMVKKNVLG